MNEQRTLRAPSALQEIISALATVFSLAMAVLADVPNREASWFHDPHVLPWMLALDTLACAYFWWEFLAGLIAAPSRRVYAATHWLEMLGAIPLALHLHWFRIVRLVRFLRFLRFGIFTVRLWQSWGDALATHPLYTLSVSSILLITAGSLGFLYAEAGVNPHVKSWWDAIWWTVVSAFTVGYGDICPLTSTGRFISLVVFILGIGIVGSFTAAVATQVIRTPNPNAADLTDIIDRLDRLEKMLAAATKPEKQ